MDTIGYFDSSHDLPEEIVMAAGLHPYKILGNVQVPNDPADQYLQNFMCPAARSVLTEALADAGKWKGIIVAHGCDATNRFFDIWKLHVKTPFLHWFNTPMNDTALAAGFFKKEMLRMASALEKQFKVSITPDKLRAAIATSNGIKRRLQQLAALRATRDVPNVDYFNACKAAVQEPKASVEKLLDDTIADWSARGPFPAGKKPAFLTGTDVSYAQWMDLLDDAGFRVVRDDLGVGERYYATSIPGSGADPYDDLVAYYRTIPRPATRNPPDPRLDYILNGVGEGKVKAVISQNLKFCEPYAYDSVFTVKALKQRGINVIHLEREYSPTKDLSLKTRLEAFAEMIH